MGGEGFALPAGTCSLIKPTIFFAIQLSCGCKRALLERSPLLLLIAFGCYAFSTCPNSSSTGVERPKIVTATRSRLFS
jgi:hypothetical protein